MPSYRFQIDGDHEHFAVNLTDDAEAWSHLVAWCGEALKDADGALKPNAEFIMHVHEGARVVAEIGIRAKGPLDSARRSV